MYVFAINWVMFFLRLPFADIFPITFAIFVEKENG